MKNDFIYKKMKKLQADGVDFTAIWFGDGIPPIIRSYTKEEWKDVQSYPKSARMYWKMVDGKKQYLDD